MFRKDFPVIIKQLNDDRKDPKAEDLVDSQFIHYLYFISDLVSVLRDFGRMLEREKLLIWPSY